jgi:hypothetical protein
MGMMRRWIFFTIHIVLLFAGLLIKDMLEYR